VPIARLFNVDDLTGVDSGDSPPRSAEKAGQTEETDRFES
jgi:hypothetical protein